MSQLEEILADLKSQANPERSQGMVRYGINAEQALGISIPILRKLAKKIGKSHELALGLWDSKIHEARILAALVAETDRFDQAMAESWVRQVNSWDLCDQCVSNLFDKRPFAWELAKKWAFEEPTFVKRAGFVMMATLAVHDKKANNEQFLPFFPLVEQGATDERNFVKKAVNWALRQMGKRNLWLHEQAIRTAEKLLEQESKAAHWIARDALRELKSPKILARLEQKQA